MDTLYQLLEWNPVQVGSTFQGGGYLHILLVSALFYQKSPPTPPPSPLPLH